MITVKVPATTANIGPGFDCLGMALNLYNTIEVSDNTDRLVIVSSGLAANIEQNENNLIYRSIKRLYIEVGQKVPPLKIVQKINIPISRGLGSSAACIVGGLTAANEILGKPVDQIRILELADELEGHPDNVAPALLGGFVVSAKTDSGVKYIRHPVNNSIRLMAMIPDFQMSTSEARAVLPRTISYSDAVFNVGRSSLLTAILITGNVENIRYAVEDKLHQPYRLELIQDGHDICRAAYDNGADAFFISGSGSTLMAIIRDDGIVDNMKNFCSKLKGTWSIHTIEADNHGVQVFKR